MRILETLSRIDVLCVVHQANFTCCVDFAQFHDRSHSMLASALIYIPISHRVLFVISGLYNFC